MNTKLHTTTESDRVDAIVQAYEVVLAAAMKPYRMGAVPAPNGPRFWHLFATSNPHLSLCQGIAMPRREMLTRVVLPHVDCVPCLREFARRAAR